MVAAVAAAVLCPLPVAALDVDKAFHHYVKDTWSIEQGLPQITVTALAQDADGYLWVGTQAGLARFDGARFTAFEPGSLPELPGMLVQALHVDSQGRLWIGTYKGMAVYADHRFASVPAADPALYPALDVQAIAETLDGRVLAATQAGVFEADGGVLRPLPGLEGAASALLVRGEDLVVGVRGGIHVVGADARRFLPLPGGAGSVVTELLAAQGTLWVGTSSGLWMRGDGSWQPADGHPSLRRSPVEVLYQDRDGNLWVGLADGMARLRQRQLHEFVPDGAIGAHRAPISALEDREGNLWLGSRWDGLARLWNGWTRRYAGAEGLHEPIVWSVARGPDGRLWVGTNDGLAVFDGTRFERMVAGDALPHPHAYTLLAEDGVVWIGTRRGLVQLVGDRLVQPAAFTALAGIQVNGIVRDRAGTLWLATLQGLFRYRDGELRRFGEADGLADRRVRLVFETREQRLLVGTQSGLHRFEGERLVPVGADAGLPPGLDVTALQQLADGRLALGTLSEQLFVYDGTRWRSYGADQGMPTNAPFFIGEDAHGFLWVAGIRGIGRVPVADLAAFDAGRIPAVRGEMLMNERGDRRAGQKGYCCNGAGNAKGFLEDGVLWLPSRGGVVSMDTAGIVKNAVAPNVRIERVRHSGAWHPAPALAGLELPPTARDLAFEFTVLSLQDPPSARLRYRLLGYDPDWQELDDSLRRSVNYTNLPPGDYRFEVQGANNADVWNPVPATLGFSLRPHLHETRWFFVLLAALVALLVYGGFRWQLRSLHRQRAQLAAEVRDRTAELQQANRQLREASHSDALTGLRNRRYLADQLPADLAFYDRESVAAGAAGQGMVMVFALVDIDRFKAINDSLGHAAGDAVLQQFARLLGRQVRTGDYLVRWGGEEFLLVFRPMSTRQLATIGERICGAVRAQAFEAGGAEPLRLTCSVGFAEYPLFRDERGSYGWQEMVELADQALYWVKRHGRDGWAAFRPTPSTDVSTLLGALRREGAASLVRSERLELVSSRA